MRRDIRPHRLHFCSALKCLTQPGHTAFPSINFAACGVNRPHRRQERSARSQGPHIAPAGARRCARMEPEQREQVAGTNCVP